MQTHYSPFNTESLTKIYDEVLRPRIFDPWGNFLLDMVGPKKGETLLDIATGPGTVARLAAVRVGKQGMIVGADISTEMLAVARSKDAPADGAPIEYVLSPASPLEVNPAAFDAAVCAHGLHFFPDQLAAIGEMKKALRSGGRVGVLIWSSATAMPLFSLAHQCLADVQAEASAVMQQRANRTWLTGGDLADMFSQCGFKEIHVSEKSIPFSLEGGIPQAFEAIGGTSAAGDINALTDEQRNRFYEKLENAYAPYVREGQLKMTASSIVLIART
jgi:ubiquinone/menaquinone biosynthesis C-methylase UbiE